MELATATYLVPENFDHALKSVRKVLADAHLKLAGELDMSGRILQNLRIEVAPCLVLFVSTTREVDGAVAADPRAAALTPLHVVLADHGGQTEIHLLRPLPLQSEALDADAVTAFRQLQTRIAQAVERIAMRSAFGA